MKYSRMKKILTSDKFHVICDESTVKVFDKDATMVGVVDNTIPHLMSTDYDRTYYLDDKRRAKLFAAMYEYCSTPIEYREIKG
nr:MAG TPA: hypothetical protein [Podoviridae sp. ctK5Q1]